MATKGRGGDSMLVHMTPGEVQALQTLAERSGGTLTINPETGQPEANFLKKMLPMIAGAALNFFAPGFGSAIAGSLGLGGLAGATAIGTGIGVGGIAGLATGSLSRGLMAGLGAYGGASLAGSLSGAGAASLGQDAITSATAELGAGATDAALQEAVAAKLGPEGAMGAFKNLPVSEQFSSGIKAAASNPGQFMRNNLGAAYAAMSPMMAADTVQTTTKRPDTGTIRNFTFDPYGQTYSDAGSYPASEYKGMAQGGIVALAAGGPSSVEDLYRDYAGRGSDPGGLTYWTERFGDTIDDTEAGIFQSAVAAARAQGTEPNDVTQAQANTLVENMYRNVLNRDVEQSGLNYWSDMIQSTNDPNRIYQDFLTSAKANTELGNFGMGYEQAVTPFQGYMSADTGSNADEWVRNVLKREVTDADRNQSWYKDMAGVTTAQEAKDAYSDFLRSTGANTNLDWMAASQLNPLLRPRTTPQTFAPEGTTNPYGNATNPGDQTFNPDGSITVQPNIPGRPYGGFTGMGQVRDAYTQGGGSLGYVNPAPKTMEEFNERFNTQTGDSLAAYNYLVGKGANPATQQRVGEIARPYSEAIRGVPAAEGRPTQKYIYQNGKYVENPNYRPLSYNSKGERMVGMTSSEVIKGIQGLKDPADDGALFDFVTENRISEAQLAAALGISLAEARARIAAGKKKKEPLSTITNLFDGGGGDSGDAGGSGDTGGDAGASGSAAGADGSGGGAGGCVDPNVMVLLADGGHVRAGDLRVGDMLHTLHEDTFVYGNFPVEFVEIIQQPKVEAGFDGNQKIIVSTTHKFLTADGVWKQMRDLVIGDVVRATGDATKKLTSVKTLGEGPVVKMTVTEAHTYIADGLVSHNKARGGMVRRMALGGLGGLGALAAGGATSQYNLGGYSDGGRLLRGPGDGVSDSIPATIGNKQPARLADGEFVVPARIVSELGNGSTEAGARKLYAMMDRVQKARGKTTGKRRVATNTRSEKYLPA
jgi:hypothetical protein